MPIKGEGFYDRKKISRNITFYSKQINTYIKKYSILNILSLLIVWIKNVMHFWGFLLKALF